MDRETEEQILIRHRKENRDLIATITGMKKQATKSKKKEVMKKCQEMEENLKAKQAKELKELNKESPDAEKIKETEKNEENGKTEEKVENDDELTPEKLNRQKERLARRDAAIEETKKQAELEAEDQVDLKGIELSSIDKLCELNKLKQFDIQPDGHCLFASIADQLKIRHNIDKSIQDLRTSAANYIRQNSDTFAPFLFSEETLTMKDIDTYTKDLETTAIWGGDMEILALAKVFDCPISVMMAGRSTLVINEEGSNPELKLVYYKYSYALGEHYNSLHDA
ncbi:hypothetical protein PACTADRAFT_186002 [Pachysolen tannophilus NRRL Y-2460]|uniref:OTU domain-containing protein n=1 Tax=Pachysolen tannophilus NRRL Y-2460 TaxID=669874 RepID=A0A1E4U170_PACTA|nr:hypothetical protein PACTADRAFT_186002 [Pachysolen tannophilus NRRL Y-2460]